jgi:hypothetical protein
MLHRHLPHARLVVVRPRHLHVPPTGGGRQCPPDQASFGIDFPLFDLSYASSMWFNFVKEQPWANHEVKAKVLGGNMRKILGI